MQPAASPQSRLMQRLRGTELWQYLHEDSASAASDLIPAPRWHSPSIWAFNVISLLLITALAFFTPQAHGTDGQLALVGQLTLCLVAGTPLITLGLAYCRYRWGGNPSLYVVAVVMVVVASLNAPLVALFTRFFPFLQQELGREALKMLGGATGFLLPLATLVYLYWRQTVQKALRRKLLAEQERADLAHSERREAEVQLEALRARVDPEFLCGSLDSVRGYAKTNPDAADELLSALIRYLRSALPQKRDRMSTLKAEFSLAGQLLEVNSIRLLGRMAYDITLPVDLEQASFPPGVLQALVDNAVEHGVLPVRYPVRVDVEAYVDGDDSGTVVVEVRDGGAGFTGAYSPGPALRDVATGLRALYADRGHFHLRANARSGATASVRIPLQVVPG